MAHASERAGGQTVTDGNVRRGWLRVMYAANVVVSAPLGLAALVAPASTQTLLGIPAGDPVSFGIANGAVPLAFGIAGVGGLRAPLRLSPVLGLQVIYKLLFLVGVVLPWVVTGRVPGYALPVVGVFVFFVVGNLAALPFDYVLSSGPD